MVIPKFPGQRGEFGNPNFSSERETSFSLKNAHEKAVGILARDAIKEQDFIDLYGSENIGRDMAKVQRLQESFRLRDTEYHKEAKTLATVLEAVVHDQINTNQWFGPRAQSLRTTDYDDLINGVDSVVEFKSLNFPAHYLALGVDITYFKDLDKKFGRIKEELDAGHLATVKYLRSADRSFRGERSFIPRIVVGVEREACESLAKTWFQNAAGLKSSPVKHQIIQEIRNQLQTFKLYARKKNHSMIVEKYAESLSIVEPLYQDSLKSLTAYKHTLTDRSLEEIDKQLLRFA